MSGLYNGSRKKLALIIGQIIIYQVVILVIFSFLLKRVGAFGCFDDCFNFGAGNFLLQGKQLYSQIFFNHQPFMAYISAAIQYLSHPQTLFELVKYHRIAVLLFADVSGMFLILRFGFPLFLTLCIFESTKFYIFGDRFLAEGIIVYPMLYLFFLVWNKLTGKTVYVWEYIVAAICSWFIFWTREPFVPWSIAAVFILFVFSLKEKKLQRIILIASGVFVALHVLTLSVLNFHEYILM